jgi:hypothetical protein
MDRTLRCRGSTSVEFNYRLLVAISVTWVTFAGCVKSVLVNEHLSRDVASIHSGQMFIKYARRGNTFQRVWLGMRLSLLRMRLLLLLSCYKAVHHKEGQCQGNIWCQAVRVLPVTWPSTPFYRRVQLTGTLLSICRISEAAHRMWRLIMVPHKARWELQGSW